MQHKLTLSFSLRGVLRGTTFRDGGCLQDGVEGNEFREGGGVGGEVRLRRVLTAASGPIDTSLARVQAVSRPGRLTRC